MQLSTRLGFDEKSIYSRNFSKRVYSVLRFLMHARLGPWCTSKSEQKARWMDWIYAVCEVCKQIKAFQLDIEPEAIVINECEVNFRTSSAPKTLRQALWLSQAHLTSFNRSRSVDFVMFAFKCDCEFELSFPPPPSSVYFVSFYQRMTSPYLLTEIAHWRTHTLAHWLTRSLTHAHMHYVERNTL